MTTGDGKAGGDTLLFLHLPKSGGTTLRHVLERQFPPGRSLSAYPTPESHAATRAGRLVLPPALAELTPEQRSRYDLVSGHFSYGIHEAFARSCRYLTFLRRPVDRVVSLYYHARAHADHVVHPLIHDEGLSLAELLETGRNALEYDDAQVRALAGYHLEDEFRRAVEVDEEAVLERAIHHLDTHFDVVGVMDAYDTSLLLAAERYGWRDVGYEVRNVTVRPSRRPEDDPEVRRLIRSHNRLDERLYDYARRRLRREVRRLGPRFRARLLWFEFRKAERSVRDRLGAWTKALADQPFRPFR